MHLNFQPNPRARLSLSCAQSQLPSQTKDLNFTRHCVCASMDNQIIVTNQHLSRILGDLSADQQPPLIMIMSIRFYSKFRERSNTLRCAPSQIASMRCVERKCKSPIMRHIGHFSRVTSEWDHDNVISITRSLSQSPYIITTSRSPSIFFGTSLPPKGSK